MLNETYRGMLAHKSVIRETFMYGKQRAAQIGYENVFDYSLGNPSVPCPERFTAAMQELLAQEDPVALHGYCPSQGDPEFRTAVAAHLNRTFGLPYAQKDIFPTTGAAGAIAHALRAVTRPGDEVLTFAPYFPEYGPYVEGTGAHLRVVPPQAPAFQPNLEAFEQMLTEKVTCVLINTPNNPTGVVYSADTLTRLAEGHSIPWQTTEYIAGGNDARTIQRSRAGVRVAAMSAAVRYLHAPASVAKINDRYRYRLTLSTKNCRAVRGLLGRLIAQGHQDRETRGVSV